MELKKEANSDFGRSCVTELEKVGWFENCWAKLSPFQKVLPIIKDKAHTAFQTWIIACIYYSVPIQVRFQILTVCKYSQTYSDYFA